MPCEGCLIKNINIIPHFGRMEIKMSLISLCGLSKEYYNGQNEVKALDNINLEIDEGEFVAIVGRSGSGKSTLMNILGCLDTQTEGYYYLNGEDVSRFDDKRLSHIRNKTIGFIFQGFNLVNNLSALENVELPLLYRGVKKSESRQLALSALQKVGLKDRVNHFPNDMSGGQQQRVAIARAIAASPPIILADEPTGNLDSSSGKDIMDILLSLNMEGKTIILITHDMSIAKSVPRVISVCDGILC